MYHPETKALGPGTRFALWTQGCGKSCPGCISPDSRPFDGGEEWETGALAEKILQYPGIEGITVSGGEPFLQAEALCELVETVKFHRDLGLIIYTGFLLEELRGRDFPGAQELLERCDLLIDGPYEASKNDGKSLRGSSNQRVISLTGRYKNCLDLYGTEGRKVEFFVHRGGKARMVGIPPENIKNFINLEEKNERH
jgi:anaerobic ribonucleoside-triphosphate reductase activating protein